MTLLPLLLAASLALTPMSDALARAAERIRIWRHEPVTFVRDSFGVTPDEWQLDYLKALGGDTRLARRVIAKACTGPGKTAALAWTGWHRLTCFGEKGEHPKGAALSITEKNLKANLWPELAKWQTRSEFLSSAFTWTKERVFANDHEATWFLELRSFARNADNEAIGRSLSGLHSHFPFILLDETGDMPPAVGQKAEQIFTGGTVDGLLAGAGNPTSIAGLLYHVCVRLREQWTVIGITADPDDPKRTPRVDIEHAREQIRLYGRDNPWVMATILGQFPPGGFNALLTVEEVEAAMKRQPRLDVYQMSQKRIGVDVARFGDDRTVLFPRQGLAAFKPVEMRNARSNEIAARVAVAQERWGTELEFVDDSGGYGAGVIDSRIQSGAAPIAVNFAGAATDERYFNKRSEIWFRMAEWVKRGGALPPIPGFVRELTEPMYTFQNGKFRLEEKDQIKKRLGFSPDYADALALTFALPDMPTESHLPPALRGRTHSVAHEYDPTADRSGSAVRDYDPLEA